MFLLIPGIVSFSANVQFHDMNKKFGISLRETNEIIKDNYGFIWVSSKMGILRLAEDDYHIYKLPYETADVIGVKLAYNHKNSVLFAYTNNGQIFKYNTIYDRFDLLANLGKMMSNQFLSVNKMLVDDNNVVWLGTSAGLYRYADGKLSQVGKYDTNIRALEWSERDRLFVAYQNKITLLDTNDEGTEPFCEGIPDYIIISKLYYDKKSHRLWVGTLSSGLFYLTSGNTFLSSHKVAGLPKQPILAIKANSDSTVLLGIDGQGIWELDKKNDQILNIYKQDSDNPLSLNGNGVYDIYCDDSRRRVWVCTYSGGVSYFEEATPQVARVEHMINNHNSLVDNDVNCIVEDGDRNIWFGTNNGISRWDTKDNRWSSYYKNEKKQAQVFLSLSEDNQGRIWAGTYSSGVYVLDSRNGQELAHYFKGNKNSKISVDYVFSIFKDSQGDIWIGGVQGDLICYSGKEDKVRSYPNYPVDVIKELSPNKILLGCTYGLLLLDKRTGETTKLVDGFLIYDILVKDNIIWLCTSGDGLAWYDIKTHKSGKFTTETGLPSNFVNSITYANGFLWLGTENGLCRFDPNDHSVLVYPTRVALSHVSFNRDANYLLRDGRLIWGTNRGAVIFNPKSIHRVSPKGKIYYQDLLISGRSIRNIPTFELKSPLDSLKSITLKYTQNTLALNLLSIGTSVTDSKFSWKLEGLDSHWSTPSGNHTLTYANIPSGDFDLKIRMYDSSMSHLIDERSIVLHMIPPFWQLGWFRFLIFLFVMGIAIIAFAYYIDRLKKRHSEEKIRFFTNTVHDIRTSLTLINAPIEELNKESNLSKLGRYYLNLATEQAGRLSSVVTQLMDFQKVDVGMEQINLAMLDVVELLRNRIQMFESLAKTKDIHLVFDTNQASCQTALDEALIERVFDNLISNAIKYSHPMSQVDINLRCQDAKWILEVKDQGIGISKKAQRHLFKEFYRAENAVNSKIVGSGIGLLLVKNYVNMHDGDILCSSQENAGTTFQITIPRKEISPEEEFMSKNEESKMPNPPLDIEEVRPGESTIEVPLKKMRILVVEDNDDLRGFLKNAFEEQFGVDDAHDGSEAWSVIQKKMPDLVVSDIMMPNMDGFELCEKMKSTYETSHIPIILLTSMSAKAQKLHGFGLGADDYLTKPFDVSVLIQKIKSIVQNRNVVRERALKLIRSDEQESILTNELNDKFVRQMLEVVRANISNTEFNKDEFASAMNVSSSLLYKKIKSLTDQSPTDFVKAVRLDHALELLQEGRHTVTEISELCGFSSVGYFSTVFKKHFGKSPTDLL